MATPARKELTETDTSRGIQNATSRFKKQREGQLLSTQLLEDADRGRLSGTATNDREYAANDPDYGEHGRSRSNRTQDEAVLLEDELEELARTDSLEHEVGDAQMLLTNPPEKPSFPGIVLSLALIKDILDAGDFTGIGIVVTTALSFLISLVLFLWLLGKVSGGWWKKKLIRGLWVRYALAVFIEFIPFVKLIPATTILVLMAHFREPKVVQALNGALERIHSGGIPNVRP
jgi:hypothetical protein